MATLNIAAAASLNNVLSDPAFQSALFAYSGQTITALNINPDSSGFLALQIAGGFIKPDVFMAAALPPMGIVQGAGMVPDSPVPLLRNSLVLIKNRAAGLPKPIASFGDVTAANTANVTIRIPNPDDPNYVPAGVYAGAAFLQFGQTVYDFAMGGTHTIGMTNVTVALNAVANSNVPAIGTVYETDANSFSIIGTTPNPVEIIANAPPTVNITIIYPVARISTGANQSDAAKFVNFVQTSTAMASFVKWGFIPMNPIS